jgi:hypothetical protein
LKRLDGAALLAALGLSACGPAVTIPYLPTPSAPPPLLTKCYAAARAFNAGQTVEWAHDLENACADEADALPYDAPCRGWAAEAGSTGTWFYVSKREPNLPKPKELLADARAEASDYAKACDYSLAQPHPTLSQ